MVKEVYLFFEEVLKNELSLTNFVSSDFSIINGRLADHYGIPGVQGLEFRKVSLPANSRRGGVMTMAAILKVTANGTTTSPIVPGRTSRRFARRRPSSRRTRPACTSTG